MKPTPIIDIVIGVLLIAILAISYDQFKLQQMGEAKSELIFNEYHLNIPASQAAYVTINVTNFDIELGDVTVFEDEK